MTIQYKAIEEASVITAIHKCLTCIEKYQLPIYRLLAQYIQWMTKIKKIARLQHMEHFSQSLHLRSFFQSFYRYFWTFSYNIFKPTGAPQSGNAQTLLLSPQFKLKPRGAEESRSFWQQLQSSRGGCYNPCTPGLGNILPCRSSQDGPG